MEMSSKVKIFYTPEGKPYRDTKRRIGNEHNLVQVSSFPFTVRLISAYRMYSVISHVFESTLKVQLGSVSMQKMKTLKI
jgi:hypothetical protein